MDSAAPLPPPPPLAELLAGGELALFLDFDGTLVDIAPRPDAIRVPGGLAEALERLAGLLAGRLALISGRSLADIRTHIGTPHIAIAGSHGIERQLPDGSAIGMPPQPIPEAVYGAMENFALANSGVTVEGKTLGAALHFRAAPEREEAVIAIAAQLAKEHGLQTRPGKCVIELVQPGTDKAGAVDAFMALPEFAGSQPVFVGDDLTDEDGFDAVARRGGFGILVGDRAETKASYALRDPAHVLEWLGL